MILPLFVALERIDPSLLAAASDLGAAGHRVFRRVVLPLAAPGIVAGCILVGVPATGEYTIPAILGGGKTLMVGNVIADQFLKIGDYPFGSALAMMLMAVLTLILVLARSRAAALRGSVGSRCADVPPASRSSRSSCSAAVRPDRGRRRQQRERRRVARRLGRLHHAAGSARRSTTGDVRDALRREPRGGARSRR